jgi:hypothetical protein
VEGFEIAGYGSPFNRARKRMTLRLVEEWFQKQVLLRVAFMKNLRKLSQ